MNYTTTLFVIALFLCIPIKAENCDDAYSSATYAFQHIETSLGWNNIQSQRQYANKAIEAMKKVQAITKNCGCIDAYNKSYDALEKLEKSLLQDTFETSRYQISKANLDAKNVLIFLDSCRNDPMMYLKSDAKSLEEQEQQLLAQQQRLIEEQKKLQERLALQKQKQAELELQKIAKFNSQKELKVEVEYSLEELQTVIMKLITALDCNQDFPIPDDFERTLDDLSEESLEASKMYYSDKVREMAYSLINNLSVCEIKE